MKKITLLVLILLVKLTSCDKEETRTTNQLTFQEFLSNNEKPSEHFTVTNSAGASVSGDKVFLNFFPGSFVHSNGDSVIGDVQVELKELFSKSEMFFSNRPTITNSGEILESDGAFKIVAIQNGEELRLKFPPIASFSHYGTTDLSMYDPEMELFIGSTNNEGQPVWVNNQDSIRGVRIKPQGPYYGLYFDDLGWLNIDKVISDSLPTVTLTVTISVENDPVTGSAGVFVFFTDINSVIGIYPNTDSTLSTPIPVNSDITLVGLSFNEEIPKMAVKNIVMSEDRFEELVLLNSSEDEIAQTVNDLNE